MDLDAKEYAITDTELLFMADNQCLVLLDDASCDAPGSAAIRTALLTGGFDRPYVSGLATALISRSAHVEIIGSDDLDTPQMHASRNLTFLNLRGKQQQEASVGKKIFRTLAYYARLIRYAATAQPKIFHILWNNKFEFFDRTILMLYYKLLGKKIVFTAHNINAGKRDGRDSVLNRVTLRVQYHLADHIFVHTDKMKRELQEDFRVPDKSVTVIPFGINDSVPNTALTALDAKEKLGLKPSEKSILFFGAIRSYKGLEYLIEAFERVAGSRPEYRLIIAGEPRREDAKYIEEIRREISSRLRPEQIIQHLRYIPDDQTEIYFKAADVLALPYTHVFQSGVLFLGFGFGLPVVATEVGSVRDEIVEGENGFLCKPSDADDLARAIRQYFESDLFEKLADRRHRVREAASTKHSWKIVGEKTHDVYCRLAGLRK